MKRMPKGTRGYFERWGRRGGQARARRLSPQRRSAIASRAAAARWETASPAPFGMASVRFEAPRYDEPAYLEELLMEGSLKDWRGLYQRVADRPFGRVAEVLENVLASTEAYGVTPLWKGLLRGVRGT